MIFQSHEDLPSEPPCQQNWWAAVWNTWAMNWLIRVYTLRELSDKSKKTKKYEEGSLYIVIEIVMVGSLW